ncbi:MAG: hypothetical protein CHACPFDD_03259 [Phycisphaerae bacterium]|nr:hypothetical protein [Phycisphaerae bacterium]
MNKLCLWSLCGMLVASPIALGQPQTTLTTTAGQYTIHANSFLSPTALGGAADFSVSGVLGDYLDRHMFAYRQTGDTREYMVADSAATFSSTANTWDATILRNVNNAGPDTLRFDVNYTLTSLNPNSPLLTWCVIVTNISNQTIDYSLFAYYDFDIPDATGVPTADQIVTHQSVGSGFYSKQQNTTTPSNYVTTYAAMVGAFQHGPVYESIFSNGGIDNLNNVWNPGIGEMAMGFQFFGTLQPGQSSICPGQGTALNGEVPEPATLLCLGAGAAVLFARRRQRVR